MDNFSDSWACLKRGDYFAGWISKARIKINNISLKDVIIFSSMAKTFLRLRCQIRRHTSELNGEAEQVVILFYRLF